MDNNPNTASWASTFMVSLCCFSFRPFVCRVFAVQRSERLHPSVKMLVEMESNSVFPFLRKTNRQLRPRSSSHTVTNQIIAHVSISMRIKFPRHLTSTRPTPTKTRLNTNHSPPNPTRGYHQYNAAKRHEHW